MSRGITVLVTLLSAVLAVSTAMADVNQGLVGYWSFDEEEGATAGDGSPNSNDGTVYGATWTAGTCGSALAFDGQDDYVDFGDILNDVQLPVTIVGWVYRRSQDMATIFESDWQVGTYFGFRLHASPDENSRIVVAYGDGGASNPSHRRQKVSSLTLSNDEWSHVVGIIRGATDMTIYINGVDAGGEYTGSGGAMLHGSQPARLGVTKDYYTGDIIDEVRIYDRALSEAEVLELYSLCHAIPTLNQWGLVTMALLVLSAGKVVFARQQQQAAA